MSVQSGTYFFSLEGLLIWFSFILKYKLIKSKPSKISSCTSVSKNKNPKHLLLILLERTNFRVVSMRFQNYNLGAEQVGRLHN